MANTEYEWDVETVENEYGDVVDHDQQPSYKSCIDTVNRFPCEVGHHYDIVLVRDVFASDDLVDRSWAYMVNGKLPERFENGTQVPKRFHMEVANS